MVIDGHSHLGKDYYNKEISLNDYTDFCKKAKIDKGIVMPTPWPCYENNGTFYSLIWMHSNYEQRYLYRIGVTDEKLSMVLENPYEIVNNEIYNSISNNQEMELYFAPLFHGILDNPNYLEQQLKKEKVVAIKVHGFGSGYTIEDINPELIEILKQYNLPLIIHTSVYNYNYGYGYDTKYWRNLDHPLRWARFLIDNNLTGILNHGAALNDEALELINNNDNLMVGLGPDLDLNNDYFKIDIPRNEYKKIDYLHELKNKLIADKIIFDIDFNWNIDPYTGLIDINAVDRVVNVWGSKDSDKILSENAYRIFSKIRK